VDALAAYLREVRGMAEWTVHCHATTARRFLQHIGYGGDASVLAAIRQTDIEGFIRTHGKGISRGYLQHIIGQLRGFLRFLAVSGMVRPGLDAQIDTPRLYRLEKLPRTLPWETVRAFLRSIDRVTALGLRDYAIFSLIVTYARARSLP
jgi:site-specific recombinase XerC